MINSLGIICINISNLYVVTCEIMWSARKIKYYNSTERSETVFLAVT